MLYNCARKFDIEEDIHEKISEKPNVKTIRQIPNHLIDNVLYSFLELNEDDIENKAIFDRLNTELELSKKCIKKINQFIEKTSSSCSDLETHSMFFEHWNKIMKTSLSLNFNYDTTHGLMLSNLFDVDNKQQYLMEEKLATSEKLKKKKMQQAKLRASERERG